MKATYLSTLAIQTHTIEFVMSNGINSSASIQIVNTGA